MCRLLVNSMSFIQGAWTATGFGVCGLLATNSLWMLHWPWPAHQTGAHPPSYPASSASPYSSPPFFPSFIHFLELYKVKSHSCLQMPPHSPILDLDWLWITQCVFLWPFYYLCVLASCFVSFVIKGNRYAYCSMCFFLLKNVQSTDFSVRHLRMILSLPLCLVCRVCGFWSRHSPWGSWNPVLL